MLSVRGEVKGLGLGKGWGVLHDGDGLNTAGPRQPFDGGADLRDHDAQAGQALLQFRPYDQPAQCGVGLGQGLGMGTGHAGLAAGAGLMICPWVR